MWRALDGFILSCRPELASGAATEEPPANNLKKKRKHREQEGAPSSAERERQQSAAAATPDTAAQLPPRKKKRKHAAAEAALAGTEASAKQASMPNGLDRSRPEGAQQAGTGVAAEDGNVASLPSGAKKKKKRKQQPQGEVGPSRSIAEGAGKAAATPAGPGSEGRQPLEREPAPVPASNGGQPAAEKAKKTKAAASQGGLAASSNGDAAVMGGLPNGHAGQGPASGTAGGKHEKRRKASKPREVSDAAEDAGHAAREGMETARREVGGGNAASRSNGEGVVGQPAEKRKKKQKRMQHVVESGS